MNEIDQFYFCLFLDFFEFASSYLLSPVTFPEFFKVSTKTPIALMNQFKCKTQRPHKSVKAICEDDIQCSPKQIYFPIEKKGSDTSLFIYNAKSFKRGSLFKIF